MNTLPSHPFGHTITVDTLRSTFAGLPQWEDKYRQLILLARQLPPLSSELKAKAMEIAGCQNRVWLGHARRSDGSLYFYGDSEGRIVKGLLAILLTEVEGKTAQQILSHDSLRIFHELGLINHLSVSRNSGLAALAEAVHNQCRASLQL